MIAHMKSSDLTVTDSPREIVSSGSDYVKIIAPHIDVALLQQALEIALSHPKKYSKTLILTLEREIRKKVRTAQKEQKLRLIQKAYE